MTIDRFEFPSFAAMLHAATHTPSLIDEGTRSSRRTDAEFSDWSGTKTFQEACYLAVNGVPELEARIQKMSDAITAQIGRALSPQSWRFDVTGEECDASRFAVGDPECMLETVWSEAAKGNRVLSLAIEGTYHNATPIHTVENRGAAVIALVDALETAGLRVEITWAYTGYSKPGGLGNCLQFHTRIKDADEPLDISRACFSLAHTSMLRRISAAVRETLPLAKLKTFNTYPYGKKGGAYPNGNGIAPEGTDIWIGRDMIDTFKTQDSARKWVLEQLKAQGVEIDA